MIALISLLQKLSSFLILQVYLKIIQIYTDFFSGKEEESRKNESDWGSYRTAWKNISDRGPRWGCLDCGKHHSCAENRSRGNLFKIIGFFFLIKFCKTGKSLSTFKGHTGPVTSLAFCDRQVGSGDQEILISGSWDKVSSTIPLLVDISITIFTSQSSSGTQSYVMSSTPKQSEMP